MDDNNSTVFVQNNILYNLPGIALVSSTNEVVNVIQPDLQNNAIFLTTEQLQSLGVVVNNDVNTPPLQIEKPNLMINQNVNNVVKVQKLQSVLINNQKTKTNGADLPKKVPVKTYITKGDPNIRKVKYVQKNDGKKILYRVAKPSVENLVNAVKITEPVKPLNVTEQAKVIKVEQAAKVFKVAEQSSKVFHVAEHSPKVKVEQSSKVIKEQTSKQQIKIANEHLKAVNVAELSAKPVEKVPKVKTNLSDLFVRKSTNEKNDKLNQNDIEEEVTLKSVRTRSGRITKPPKHLKREKDTPKKEPNLGEPSPKQVRTLNDPAIGQEITNPFKMDDCNTPPILPILNQPTALNKVPVLKKRKIASTKYRCKTCQRFYLGRVKMKKHLKLNPDHKVPKKYESDNQLWLDLLERTYNAPKIEQVNVFIGELTHILEKVKNLVPKGLKPLVNESDPNSFKIDSTLSTLLGVSQGKYVFDIEVLNGNPGLQEKVSDIGILETINSIPIETLIDEKLTDSSENAVQTSLLNLLDTGQVHFDTDSSNTSEAVRCVDQLVNERLKILTDVELNPTSNGPSLSPPNITLDLSMDMFPYTS